MNSGRIDYSPDYKPESAIAHEVSPPKSRTLRFCPKCGRHDGLGGALRNGHWNQGKLCGGVTILVEYRLADAERARLEREVIKTCSAYCQSVLDIEDNGWPKGMTINEAHVQHAEKQTAMIDAYKALL